jgi:hypothetical protein
MSSTEKSTIFRSLPVQDIAPPARNILSLKAGAKDLTGTAALPNAELFGRSCRGENMSKLQAFSGQSHKETPLKRFDASEAIMRLSL